MKWICPRYVILLSHFSKRDQKESHFSPQTRRKKRRKNLTLSSFPDLSSFFKEDTFSIALLLLLLLQREREKDRGERERDKVRKFESEYRDNHVHDALKKNFCGISSLKQKSSAISFLVTTSSSSPLTLHLLRSRYI